MRYCRKCVQPDTRPGSVFDEEGVCLACRFAETVRNIDWAARRAELEEICSFARERNVSGYDCIVGVSGGKDSTRQAMYVRDELKLHPLLVCCSYPPENLSDRGARNLANLMSLGFDCITVGPAPGVWKRLMLQGFLRFGNWAKSTEMALYASAPKVAIAYQIPLIFLGENPAISVGTMDVKSTNGDANQMKNCNTLKGGPEALLEDGITERDLFWYRYSSDEDMQLGALKVVYLGYYIQDFTKRNNALFSIRHGLEVRPDPPEDIGDITGYECLDDDFVLVNQHMKHIKFGFGKVTEQVCEDIRLGDMTREEAWKLVLAYDGKCAERYIQELCDYLGISRETFREVSERYRGRGVWTPDGSGGWRLAAEPEFDGPGSGERG
ncbi:N-acetyl sugar amidotransferase [Desulfovibrio aminophilus]|nr:N-acetyl sugar amidotransferase [Desulfovibrio aminophilus]MCM0753962.1 N-acetyl sugar amidotransferase [Desulfovibrio aminophilus]